MSDVRQLSAPRARQGPPQQGPGVLGDLPSPTGTLLDRLGIEVLEAAPSRVVATMPVAGNTQLVGLLHGGASAALAETVGSLAAMLHGWPERHAVGLDLNATHHRSATSGTVTATATAISLGRTVCAHEVVIVDDEGRRLCTARITNLMRERRSA